MIRSYFIIAIRTLWKNQQYSLINIIGLALGITMSGLILLYVSHEYSYDTFHAKAKRIFKINADIHWGEQTIHTTSISPQFGPALCKSSPYAEKYVRMREPGRVIVSSGHDHKFFEDQFIFTDSSFFSVFDFPILNGSVKAFQEAAKVLITPEMSKKYFGDQSPIGQYLTYQNKTDLEIVGIVAPAPSNSKLQFQFIASFPTLAILPDPNETRQYNHDKVSLGSYPTYLLLTDPAQAQAVTESIPTITEISADETYSVSPLLGEPHNPNYLKIFASVAALVLALALINYMNLTTARATTRAREVGVRKVNGARRSSIYFQFYLESAILTMIAFGLAYILMTMALPYFQMIVNQNIDVEFFNSPFFKSLMIGLFILCVLSAGSYPALILSRFNPAEVLKGKGSSASKHGTWVRKGLTAFQFTVSIALIICSLIVQQQLEFMRYKDIGMNKDQVMVIDLKGLDNSYVGFRNEISQIPNVKNIAQASVSLFKDVGLTGFFIKTPTTKEDVFINIFNVDEKFFETLDIEWDTPFKRQLRLGDYVINEAALPQLKITRRDIEHPLHLFHDSSQIVAIAKDFNYSSLKQKINGVMISIADFATMTENFGNQGSIYVRFNHQANMHEMVDTIREIYKKQKATAPFEYYFLDDAFQDQYEAEENLARIFKIFTGLAIAIACLGLLGLITFTVDRKTKEIGIRKVLGASVSSILRLLSREFMVLALISFGLACPLAWYFMNHWLRDFPYRVNIEMVTLVIAGVIMLGVALLTILSRALKAATSNPVDSLRQE